MNNRSIAWWLRQIGLSQYTKTLESEYYGLEGLLNVTNGELKDAGIEDAEHRETILTQLSRHRQKLDPHADVEAGRSVRRKYSLGSSVDLVKLRKDLFRQSVLPRLQRADKKHQLSTSSCQPRPQDDGAFSMKDTKCRSHLEFSMALEDASLTMQTRKDCRLNPHAKCWNDPFYDSQAMSHQTRLPIPADSMCDDQ